MPATPVSGRDGGRLLCLALLRLLPPHAARYELEFVQPAFERAVKERGAPGRRKPDFSGQPEIAAQDVSAPAAEAALQCIAEQGIKGSELALLAETHAIGGIGND